MLGGELSKGNTGQGKEEGTAKGWGRFDGPERGIEDGALSRRGALGLFGGALFGAAGLTFLAADSAEAKKKKKKKKKRRRAPGPSTGVTVSPSVLDFGEVGLGDTQTLPLTIINNGSTPVTVAPDGVVGDGFSLVGGPVTVAPGETKVVEVIFAPTGPLVEVGDIVPGAIDIVDVNDVIVSLVPLLGVVGGVVLPGP